MADRYVKVGITNKQYVSLLSVSKDMGFKSPTAMLRNYIEQVTDKAQYYSEIFLGDTNG